MEVVMKERAILIGLNVNSFYTEEEMNDRMSELRGLAESQGVEVLGEIVQNRPRIEAKTYIGQGKVIEIKEYLESLDGDMVIFNNELSGSQIRNLEEGIGKKIIDRTTLILDIFASRAVSMEGKLQVKLAQLKYRLPRLMGFGNALSRLGGGIGTRGPGEQQLETDRRHIRREISQLSEKLEKNSKNREIRRKERTKSHIPVVSLVGYTNAGKSTIMNGFLNLSVREENKYVYEDNRLFATLDTSHRNINIEGYPKFILSDTVGFVSELPTELVEAFKSTLEEIIYSDFILLVADISSSKLNLEIETTKKVLKDLGVNNIPTLLVYNKIDLIDTINEFDYYSGEEMIQISAKEPKDIFRLSEKIFSLMPNFHRVRVNIPFDKMNLVSYFKEHYSISDIEYDEEGAIFHTMVDERDYREYKEFMDEE